MGDYCAVTGGMHERRPYRQNPFLVDDQTNPDLVTITTPAEIFRMNVCLNCGCVYLSADSSHPGGDNDQDNAQKQDQ